MIVWELIEASSGINSWQLAYHKRMDGAGAEAGAGAGAGAAPLKKRELESARERLKR
jgi:hypothetical protein